MFQRSLPVKSKSPCSVCAKRKVKCDRLVPCGHCKKRGTESLCIQSATRVKGQTSDDNDKGYLTGLLHFWQSYEYWVPNIGLFKTEKLEANNKLVLDVLQKDAEFWEYNLTEEGSNQLLNFTVENLGTLFFGCLGDLSELFKMLEKYHEGLVRTGDKKGSDDCYTKALLWSILAMGIYYAPYELVSNIIDINLVQENTSTSMEEEIQLHIFNGFVSTAIKSLYECNFLAQPDIRFIQSVIIISTTPYPFLKPIIFNGFLVNAIYLTKLLRTGTANQSRSESLIGSIANEALNRLWYRLCSCDYIQSGPNKAVEFHREIGTLLKHAAYLEDLPNTDIFKEEDNFEILMWKILSLDRDLEQYLNNGLKPPPKTLDAVQREAEIYMQKVSALEDDRISINSQFERFLGFFLVNTILWKLQKLQLIFYENVNSLPKIINYTQVVIKLIVNNFEQGRETFNKHPLIIYNLSRFATFLSFYHIFDDSEDTHNIVLDLNELIVNMPPILGVKLVNLKYLIMRFTLLKKMLKKGTVIETNGTYFHPVFKILQNDVTAMSRENSKVNVLLAGLGSLIPGRSFGDDLEDDESTEDQLGEEFQLQVSEFEDQYPIREIIYR
ncbi:Cep3p [Nakaseomyces bracarensis]|uniref:Cep3p n=1 Tax=Nakaseomyces bracarensis TaxID=273131 RepID=UPI003872A10D